jgi:magnesium and cobalt transporter
VFDDTLDNITGILYAKDLLPFVIDDDEPMLGWHTLVRPASFIPISKAIDVQLRDFKASRTHIAIVSDDTAAPPAS